MGTVADRVKTAKHREYLANPKVQAILKTIRVGEGTSGEDGYGTRVGGGKFNDFSSKPGKRVYIKSIGDYSTAEGAYQFLNKTWEGTAKRLGLSDFSPESQDIAAVDLILHRGAMDNILGDDFEGAIDKLAPEWASLPKKDGRGYYSGQKARSMESLYKVYSDGKPMSRPKTSFTNFEMEENRGNLATVPDQEEKPEVMEAVSKLNEKQNEENFLKSMFSKEQEDFTVPEPKKVVAQQIAPTSIMDTYDKIDSFVEAQQGGMTRFLKQKVQPREEKFTVQRDATTTQRNNTRSIQQLNVKNKTDKEIATEREAKIQASVEAQKTPYTKENWRRQLAVETATTGDKLRVSNEPNFFDDYINPAVMVGNMASNLGQSPLQAEQLDSILPYVTSVGTPLTVGALAGLGTQSTGQFINNLANPLAGIENAKFSSEINWGNWNKEIVDNPQLMKEYNAIEQTSKANGSWMKNSDGTKFKGTPEQFVQQSSENFKKAFGNTKVVADDGSPLVTYHGTRSKFDTFDPSKNKVGFHGNGVYSSPSKEIATNYSRDGNIMELYSNVEKPMIKDLSLDNANQEIPNMFDGVIANSGDKHFSKLRSTEVVTKTPSQIKSALNNNGMFDMTNPNIYKALVPALYFSSKQQGGIIEDNQGQWTHPGAVTKIDGGNITMKGVNYPVLGVSNLGEQKMMYPNKDYQFQGAESVTEYPQLTEKEKNFIKAVQKYKNNER